MKVEHDFTKAKRSPYVAKLTRAVTLRLDEPTIEYFVSMAAEVDVPYQVLIKLYLRDCARSARKLSISVD